MADNPNSALGVAPVEAQSKAEECSQALERANRRAHEISEKYGLDTRGVKEVQRRPKLSESAPPRSGRASNAP